MRTTTMTAPAPTQNRPPAPAARPNLPKGVRWSNAWKVGGVLTENPDPASEMPVNSQWELVGTLWVCPADGCPKTDWTFDAISAPEDIPACTRHLTRLVASRVDAADQNPIKGARARAAAHLHNVYERRKERVVQAAQARYGEAQKAVGEAAKTTAADMKGHAPSIAVSAAVLGAGLYGELTSAPLAAAVGAGLCTFGAIAAYLVAWWLRKLRKSARGDAKQARRNKQFARHIAAGILSSGIWLILSAGTAALPTFWHALLTLLLGFLLMFAVNNAHWQELWDTRHRIKDMNRLRAEAAARRAAEEAERLAQQPAVPGTPAAAVVDETDPLVVGERMAAEWRRIIATPSVPTQFPQMPRTMIKPDETREISVPDDDGNLVRIGWEYSGHAEPGALVARPGMVSPIVAARDWLSAVLFDGRYDASMISVVDRPGGNVNRFVITISERFQLGNAVAFNGRAGIRRGSDGSLYGHIGRTLLGDDAERVLWVPGQAGGGGRYGVTGSGKSVVTQISLLNDLYAAIFSMLWDGKNLMDFAEFIGVIPMGCTVEHRDVMYRSIRAEMERRQQMLTLMEGTDRYGRPAPVEALWDPRRDGPPQRWTIEEFHMNARDEEFIDNVTELARLQRSSATMLEISTQGGGLADAGNSVLRDQLNQVAMQIMRMGDNQARLTGYSGDYMPSRLPRLPGMMLMVEADAPAIPVRAAFVHRRDEDGNIYDHLYDQDNNPILTAPVLPPETVEVYEREGLMDLWRLGQGPGGKQRLLSSGPVSPSAVPVDGLGPFASRPMKTSEVLLAIAWKHPGLGPTAVLQHPLWLRPMAGGKAPAALSTITRGAAVPLEKAGKLSRDNGYQVTEKAAAEAEAHYQLLVGDAGAERQAEADAEQAEARR
jgi:hypothetical protein